MNNKVNVELYGDRSILITRRFNAPPELVFDAFTKPEMMKEWFNGPPGWKLTTCEVDLRPGGKYRRVWSDGSGKSMGMGGVFTELQRPTRAVRTERYDDPWYPGEAIGTFELTADGGGTLMKLTLEYESKDVRDMVIASPAMAGMGTGYTNLEVYLEKLQAGSTATRITVTAHVKKPVAIVWKSWTAPEHITQWCAASDDWHCPKASNDLRTGGSFSSTMAARDGSFSFDFGGTYDDVQLHKRIAYTMGDGRTCEVLFTEANGGTEIIESFDAETQNSVEMQRGGWQAILDRFTAYTERLD